MLSAKHEWSKPFSLEVENRRLKGQLGAHILHRARLYLLHTYMSETLETVTSYGGFGYKMHWNDQSDWATKDAGRILGKLLDKVNVNEVVAFHPTKIYMPY